MLSIEGLNRLARQVIREFVAHAPTEQIDEFDYRTALPNFLRVELAPQYWIGSPDGLSKETAGLYFDGLVSILLETLAPTAGVASDGPEVAALPLPRHWMRLTTSADVHLKSLALFWPYKPQFEASR
jgi:hypothetical protein